jgi:mono/diheme cytochrome c family protein
MQSFPKLRLRSLSSRLLLCGAAALAMPALGHAASCTPGQGDYSAAQAAQGKTLYLANCAECHNADLKGNSGPALGGHDFDSYLHFSKISAQQLLSFINAQMPYQAPGSLKPDEYTKIFAYILQANGYKAGNQDLTPDNVACVSMLPYPGDKQ